MRSSLDSVVYLNGKVTCAGWAAPEMAGDEVCLTIRKEDGSILDAQVSRVKRADVGQVIYHKTAKRSNYICNELFTWADVYDTANHDERRAILQQFIKEIRVRKDYEISITLNASFNQVEQLKAVSTYDGAEIFEEISEKGA